MRVAQGSHLDAGSEAILPRLCLWLSGHDPDHSSALHSSVAQGETHVLFLGPKFPYLRIVGWERHGGRMVGSFWRPSKLWARPSSSAPPWHTTHTKNPGEGHAHCSRSWLPSNRKSSGVGVLIYENTLPLGYISSWALRRASRQRVPWVLSTFPLPGSTS